MSRNNGADVGSVEMLRDFAAALQNFSDRKRELLEGLERSVVRRVGQIEERREAWQRELRQRQRAYDDADEEDDLGYISMKIGEAEDQLRQIRRWVRRVRESQAYFTRCADTVASGPDQRAIAFLQRRVAELEEYLATRIGPAADSATPPVGADILMNVVNATEITVTSGFDGLVNSPLPEGIVWVPLTAISAAEMASLPSDDDYKKISKTEMEHGFAALQNDIVPAIMQHGANSDYFYDFDRKSGQTYEKGLQRVYDAFFGSEPITLDRNLDGETFNITAGRHRIKVARELGWPAVPAKLI